MFYRLFRDVVKYIVYGNTFSSFGFGGVKGRPKQVENDQQHKKRSLFLNEGLNL